MSTTTRSETETTTITAGDIRKVMSQVMREIEAICQLAAHLARDFDVEDAREQLSLFVLNDVISSISVQAYIGSKLVTEYCFRITPQPIDAYGPTADQPPSGVFPEEARLRLVVTHNLEVAESEREFWFQHFGWKTAKPLHALPGMRRQAYGAFRSGGISVERSLMVNEHFDRPTAPHSEPAIRKETW